ncbi:hypothetical protein B0A48_07638 [Cryoendolithus antarcticus]|uniref:EF-hand domain-containing protein n=1 Tax=Cryoendolithus antarcticus TaxID=1507870 RepID=A0A1V8T7B1_9PEZI|nr:hypothetical protein B0A48_07638 [Cryoendolithus antarcticus]
MSTPVGERPEPSYPTEGNDATLGITPSHSGTDARRQRAGTLPSYNINQGDDRRPSQEKSSDGEGTVIGEHEQSHEPLKPRQQQRPRAGSHLTVDTQHEDGDHLQNMYSPSQSREQSNRMADDLMLHKIERQVSEAADAEVTRNKSRTTEDEEGIYRTKSRKREDHVDEFDIATNPVHEKTTIYKPPEDPASKFSRFVKKVHGSNWLVRYFTYITPLTLILLAPCLVGFLAFPDVTVGGVYLGWFMVWWEIVWLTLWLSRIIAKCLPWPIGLISGLFTNNNKKWRDMGKQLELPATIFFWCLSIEVSFLPLMTTRLRFPTSMTPVWMGTMNKVLISILVLAGLNFVEKIIIQLIAMSFHKKTYQWRIEINRFQIGSLTKLYAYSKDRIEMDDSEFEEQGSGVVSGALTPGAFVDGAAKQTKQFMTKFGDVAGKMAGDFTGKQVTKSTHPSQVTIALLSTTTGAQVLARRLYRTFANETTERVEAPNLHSVFEDQEEAAAAFSMFDKDLNGDISMEELEAVCVEIGRERKSITASLKDLDSVVAKLDDVFMFIVVVITILVLISLISTSAAAGLTSAGSAVLALSWLFSATAQEFLQSIIFVFVKHPFDVGDRVQIYGNTGAALKGDDYFVKEISLLYTTFKKMEGQVVQAPNSYLNTLFILNHRRSGGLAEALPTVIKWGTTMEQMTRLRERLLDFVREENREYQPNILTELRELTEVYSLTLNVIFFYKSSWQNEGLRLARRNKFICKMMVIMQELGIEGPLMRHAGLKQSFPMYYQPVPYAHVPGMGVGGQPDVPDGYQPDELHAAESGRDAPIGSALDGHNSRTGSAPFSPASQRVRGGSILRDPSHNRNRRESLSTTNRRVDFSLGASANTSSNEGGDVYEDRERDRLPANIAEMLSRRHAADRRLSSESASRNSGDAGHSSSLSRQETGGLLRRATDNSHGSRGPSHRNRFQRWRPGTGDEAELMENGMADIPEVPPSTANSGTRLENRGGVAWRDEREAAAMRPLGRSVTEGIEMRRL